jgi:hypothetical protein
MTMRRMMRMVVVGVGVMTGVDECVVRIVVHNAEDTILLPQRLRLRESMCAQSELRTL